MAEQAGIEGVPALPKLPAKLERQYQAMLAAMDREWPGTITDVSFEQLNQDQQALFNGTVTFGVTEEDMRQRIDLAWDEQNSTLATTPALPAWSHCSSRILGAGRHVLGDSICPSAGSWRLGWPWLTLKQVRWTGKGREPGEDESFVLHLEITPGIAADLRRAEREHAVDLTQTLFWSTAQLVHETAELSYASNEEDGLDALCQSLNERGLRYLVPAEPHTLANWGERLFVVQSYLSSESFKRRDTDSLAQAAAHGVVSYRARSETGADGRLVVVVTPVFSIPHEHRPVVDPSKIVPVFKGDVLEPPNISTLPELS
ncbi:MULTISPECIES: hypothetical protein [Streptomyces]|uniref:Uncharacterized protein n=1 Tax=Streptomyces clavifer TaxID=68188 RepID=A0ABS4VFP8_9ACTN|nr:MULTISPECIES: hypothetical protein [Streptomyces]MBP2362748.1 hypothetical protein [Streptomyces clavifer]MDX2742725.1 hypothetical protein [Streptomyces sp. NRRL_B-2557]GHB02018.1 hypothetical protein GCM10010392_30960 [Streptomyces clavifer]